MTCRGSLNARNSSVIRLGGHDDEITLSILSCREYITATSSFDALCTTLAKPDVWTAITYELVMNAVERTKQ